MKTPHARILFAPIVALGLAVYSHAQVVDPLPPIPPNVSVSANAPIIMLNMSRDHQLFFRAYNEFTDIDGDGVAETTYKHSIDYGGYFDPTKCYTYDNSNKLFNPTSVSTTKYCSGTSSEWSGNFLNWAAMTRMDLVRLVLYGGYRSTDTASTTVLERAHLVNDAHSFAKYFKTTATEMRKLTPVSETQITLCSTGRPSSSNTPSAPDDWSQTQVNPPLMRFAKGNYTLWAANERRQCNWSEMTNNSNNNNAVATGFPAAGSNPSSASQGLGDKDYVVRVKVCVSGLIGTERCQAYGSSLKPVGLLHEYGETDQAEFGLITGSFANNIQGGVLRRNVTSFKSEINTTDGTYNSAVKGIVYNINKLRLYGFRQSDGTYYKSSASGGTDFCDYQTIGLTNGRCQSWGNPMGEMFLEGLRYFGGKAVTSSFDYTNAGSPDNDLGLTKESWIDPYLRSNATERSTIEAKYGKAQCRKSNIINFNASVTSYDGDDLGGYSDLNGSTTVAGLIDIIGAAEGIHGQGWSVGNNTASGTTNSCDVKTVTTLGEVRGLCPDGPGYKGSYSLAGLAYWAHTNPVRTDYSSFGLTSGTAPLNAFKINTYSVALAPAKPRIDIVTASGKRVSISPAYRLDKANNGSQIGNGTLVDFREISRTATSGSYLINWEDSEQGGDFDMDNLGMLTWTLTGDSLDVKTQIIGAATGNGQGFGYAITGVKNPNTGLSADGIHYHSGIYGFDYTDSHPINVTTTAGGTHPNINASGGCKDCSTNKVGDWTIESGDVDAPSVAHYTVAGGASSLPFLLDPLWFAAKWGGFTTNGTSSDTPNATAKWDAKINATGVAGSDGIPDNYAVVYRPDELAKALRAALESIKASSNNAPAVSSSQLQNGGLKYVASFDPNDGSGTLRAYELGSTGFSTVPKWKGEALLKTQSDANTRKIITSTPDSSGRQTGIPFNWSNLSNSQQSDLRAGTTDSVSLGQSRLAWLRGRGDDEGSLLKNRPETGVLGGIVNASPWVQSVPSAAFPSSGYTDSAGTTYSSFRNGKLSRRSLLWAGANDGMLHAFDAGSGTPILSFVPAPLFPRLRGITEISAAKHTAMVDGSPFVGDVIVPTAVGATTTAWRSYLFGSLGRGGKGVYALDVTDTSDAALTEAHAADIFRWQFTASDDSDLGYVTADVTLSRISKQAIPVVKMNNGKFALLLGNGVKSSSGHAALYILYVDGPDAAGSWSGRYKKIVLDSTSTDNGLMQPNWVDTNNDRTPDAIYAGDVKGNLWKIDVSDSNPDNWGIAYQGYPLYTALDTNGTSPLAITSMPVFASHPKGGTMVIFGTGRALETGDFPNNSRTQRIFGIWDKTTYGPSVAELTTTGAKALPRGYSELATRTLTRPTSTTGYLSGTSIDWSQATSKGWVLPLPSTGEAVLSNPMYFVDLLAVLSVAPAVSLDCNASPPGYLNILDPVSGMLNTAVMGTTSVTDAFGVTRSLPVASIQLTDQKINLVEDLRRKTTTTGPGCDNGHICTIIVTKSEGDGSGGGNSGGTGGPSKSISKTRLSWREIPTLITK